MYLVTAAAFRATESCVGLGNERRNAGMLASTAEQDSLLERSICAGPRRTGRDKHTDYQHANLRRHVKPFARPSVFSEHDMRTPLDLSIAIGAPLALDAQRERATRLNGFQAVLWIVAKADLDVTPRATNDINEHATSSVRPMLEQRTQVNAGA
jgi:hypothetical protein